MLPRRSIISLLGVGLWLFLPALAAPLLAAASFEGQVLDGQEQAVAGVLVLPLEIKNREPVETGSDGRFVLSEIPGEVTVLAAKGVQSARLRIGQSARSGQLTLQMPAPVDAEALAQRIIARGSGYWHSGDFTPDISIERLEKVALAQSGSLDDAGDPVAGRAGEVFGAFVSGAVLGQPEWAQQHAARLLEMFAPGDAKREAEATLAPLRAQSSDAAERDAAAEWLARELAIRGAIDETTVTRFVQIARVAHALKRPDAASLLEFAGYNSDQIPETARIENGQNWGAGAAVFGETAFASFTENWKAQARLAALGGAVRTYCETGDIEAARRALKAMDALAIKTLDKKNAIVPAPGAEGAEFNFLLSPSNPVALRDGARGALVRALSKRDPAAALLQVEGISDPAKRQNAWLFVANGARESGDKATATAALRRAVAIESDASGPYALAAWYASQVDPALGAEFFDAEQKRLQKQYTLGDRFGVGDLAFYLARLDPARSRLLVEREWSARAAKWGKNRASFGIPVYQLTRLVRAMLVIDPARAEEMAAQLEPQQAGASDIRDQLRHAQVAWLAAFESDEKLRARGDLTELF